MNIRRIIPKLLLSSVLSFFIFLLISMLSMLPSFDSKLAADIFNVIVALSGSVAFSVFLIYFLHVYDGSGESGVWEEYPDRYPGFFKDVVRIAKRDKHIILMILALGLICTLLWGVNTLIFHSKLLDTLSYLFCTATSLATVVKGPLGYILGTLITCLAYVVSLAVFRWYWRKYM